jgi:hypothetical protein
MTDQSDTPASQAGDPTVPLVPENGYTQPEVPPLEDTTWPDFSYDDPSGQTIALPTTPAPSMPAPTTPLPYVGPQPGVAYQQPSAPPYRPEPQRPPQPAYQSQPGYPPQPPYQTPQPSEPTMYEPYQPYTPPTPAVYNYPLAVTAAPEHPNAVASLVLGIAGVFVLPVLAPVAWIVAGRGRREMARYPGRWSASGSLTAGYVLGIIGTLVWGALVALLVLIVLAATITSFR